MPLLGALSNQQIIERLSRMVEIKRSLLLQAKSAPAPIRVRTPRIGLIARTAAEVLEAAGTPMSVAEIHEALEAKLNRPINRHAVRSCLAEAVATKKGKYRRVRHGVYTS